VYNTASCRKLFQGLTHDDLDKYIHSFTFKVNYTPVSLSASVVGGDGDGGSGGGCDGKALNRIT
jgi:hypothetical protein